MYTLRIKNEEGCSNRMIGDRYLSVSKFDNTERFNELIDLVFPKNDNNRDDIISFVVCDTLKIPIYKSDEAYIMTDSGKTFSCLNKA